MWLTALQIRKVRQRQVSGGLAGKLIAFVPCGAFDDILRQPLNRPLLPLIRRGPSASCQSPRPTHHDRWTRIVATSPPVNKTTLAFGEAAKYALLNTSLATWVRLAVQAPPDDSPLQTRRIHRQRRHNIHLVECFVPTADRRA